MHRPSAIEAASSSEKRGGCSHTASRPYILCCYKGAGILKTEICAGQSAGRVLFKQQHHFLQQQPIFECTAAINSIRDGPMGDGFGCGDESCIV